MDKIYAKFIIRGKKVDGCSIIVEFVSQTELASYLGMKAFENMIRGFCYKEIINDELWYLYKIFDNEKQYNEYVLQLKKKFKVM